MERGLVFGDYFGFLNRSPHTRKCGARPLGQQRVRLSLCEYRHGGDYQNGNNQLQVHEGSPAVCDDDVFTGRVDVAEIFLSASTPSHPKIQT
jgi:hypothetical protein